jgi:hypothetical protein
VFCGLEEKNGGIARSEVKLLACRCSVNDRNWGEVRSMLTSRSSHPLWSSRRLRELSQSILERIPCRSLPSPQERGLLNFQSPPLRLHPAFEFGSD